MDSWKFGNLLNPGNSGKFESFGNSETLGTLGSLETLGSLGALGTLGISKEFSTIHNWIDQEVRKCKNGQKFGKLTGKKGH